MNVGRQTLLILIGCLCSGVGTVQSQTRLPDSAFEDWSAVVNETALPDGSVLFDYSARTFSGRTEGAMLAISFVPTIQLRTHDYFAQARRTLSQHLRLSSWKSLSTQSACNSMD